MPLPPNLSSLCDILYTASLVNSICNFLRGGGGVPSPASARTEPPPPTTQGLTLAATPCRKLRSPSYYRRLKKRGEARKNLDSSFFGNACMKGYENETEKVFTFVVK